MTHNENLSTTESNTIVINESELQREADTLVHQEVILCQSSLVDAMLAKDVFSYDDIENTMAYTEDQYYYTESGDTIEVYCPYRSEDEPIVTIELTDELNEQLRDETWGGIDLSKLEDYLVEAKVLSEYDTLEYTIDDLEKEPVEIYEWWVVSPWLEDELRANNEAILDNDYGTWWGRTCSGQAISMDHFIRELTKDRLRARAGYEGKTDCKFL